MKFLLTVLLFFFFIKSALTQNTKLDSLDKLINKATSDTARINLANKKNLILSRINIDSAIILGNKTVKESRLIKYTSGEAAARLHLANNYCMKGTFGLAAENLSLAKNMYEFLKDSAGLCSTYSGYGTMYGMQSKYDTSIQYLERAIAIAERNSFKDKLSTYYGNIAIGHQMQSHFLKALGYQQKSLDIARADNDISGQAFTNLNMGLTYSNIGDTIRAKQFMLESIRLAKIENIKNVELYAYSNLANLYSKKGEIQKSYEFAMKAVQLAKEMGDYGIEAASLAKAAESLADFKRYNEAEKMARQAIVVADSSGQTYNVYQAYSAMGSILKQQQKYKQALPFLEKSVVVLEKTDLYNEAVGVTYFNLSLCYEKEGKYQRALTYYKTSAEISDSILNRDNVRKATELSMNYDFDKKQEAQRIEQKNKDAITKARQLALIIVFVLTLILAVVAFSAFRIKQKANFQLQKQKEEIESTLTKLKETQTQLIQSEKMASLGELTAGIAHEIQNPLNFVNNFSEVSIELINELKQDQQKASRSFDIESEVLEDIAQNLQKIHHHGQRADSIVKGMLQHSRSSTGKKELVSLNNLTDEYLRLSYHGLRAKDKHFNVTMQKNFDENLGKVNMVQQEIGRVFLNLFNNAFFSVSEKKKQQGDKYEPIVSITSAFVPDFKDGGAEIKIKDNGMGIPKNVLDKIFQPFFTTKPTGQGTGLGLSLSFDIIKAHGGEMKVETRAGEFAEFIITLPL